MDLRELIDELIADFAERELPPVTPRRLELPGLPGKADVIVGMRRSGKTYFLYQQIHERAAAGIGRDRVLYLNFEDERLLPMGTDDLHQVPEAFYRRYPASRDQICWFFFDEIHNVPGWERFVRRLIDAENVRLVVSGSSAKLLGREIATSLRGRSLTSELLPFSFEEALWHDGVETREWPPSARQRSIVENRFERYLEVGGFPEVQGLSADLRLRVLQDYVDVVLFRDVVERHEVENLPALRYLERCLLSRPANKFSVHKVHNDCRSQGIRVGKDALHRYLEYLEDAFLLFTTTVASPSARVRQTNPRKCYPIDHGLAAASSFSASSDVGHLLESLVYVELRRRGRSMSYVVTSGGHEVDFLAETRRGERELVQVCADVASPETRHRELRALDEAMREVNVETATVVTLRDEEAVEIDGRRVKIVPAWRWLLDR
jgi:uncharacterized protein